MKFHVFGHLRGEWWDESEKGLTMKYKLTSTAKKTEISS